MKKTIAKFMAAAMLVASMPAMVLPTFTVKAAPTFTTTVVKFVGTYSNGKVYTNLDDDNANKMSGTALKLNPSFGMTTANGTSFATNLQYLHNSDSSTAAWTVATADQKYSARDLKGGISIKGDDVDLSKVYDFHDNTGAVNAIKLDNDGKMTIDFKTFSDAQLKDFREGNNNTIEFTPWHYDKDGNQLTAPVFTIQVGEVFTADKTEMKGVGYTIDGYVTDADVKVNKDGKTVTLIKVSDNDKKVTMKGKKIDISSIEVGGVSYDVTKLDEQALKKGKMKKVTAKKVKNVMTGALRNCKKLRTVNMSGSKIKRIHSNAFYDCEKLKNIKIKCHNLKAVGHYAFKKLKNNATISIKAGSTKKYNAVVKMIKKSGTDKVKFKKA